MFACLVGKRVGLWILHILLERYSLQSTAIDAVIKGSKRTSVGGGGRLGVLFTGDVCVPVMVSSGKGRRRNRGIDGGGGV